jgi:Domain of unknown function (DUF5615)
LPRQPSGTRWLLLDETYPSSIAEGLRAWGRDALAIVERTELRGLPDEEVFAAAQRDQRTLVTEDISDVSRIVTAYDLRHEAHHGRVLVHPGSCPLSNPRTIGAMVTAFGALAGRYPGGEPTSLRVWL